MKKISDILNKTARLDDRKLSRDIRLAAISGLDVMIKEAQSTQAGIFQHFRDGIIEYPTRQNTMVERGGKLPKEKELYPVADHPEIDTTTREYSRSLSTRYSPDRVGIQARRLADGVYQDPYTNKIYNWNEGFTTEDGAEFNGSSVELQTDIFRQ